MPNLFGRSLLPFNLAGAQKQRGSTQRTPLPATVSWDFAYRNFAAAAITTEEEEEEKASHERGKRVQQQENMDFRGAQNITRTGISEGFATRRRRRRRRTVVTKQILC